ncbi:hypothetical protein [uncultured Methanofollis sp.]|nr:hypothetical protein [uncultured Methanofollis sp.]
MGRISLLIVERERFASHRAIVRTFLALIGIDSLRSMVPRGI